jgi:hypothetical protein
MEPEEGAFEFTQVQEIIDLARSHKLHLILLWFGSWKNSMSCYCPSWVKRDFHRFPRAKSKEGIAQEILSPFYENNLNADIKAFLRLMRFIKAIDRDHQTIIMVQVENEIGMLPDARDFSHKANEAFEQPVTEELMTYLNNHKSRLRKEILELWSTSDFRTQGNWKAIFGESLAAMEVFIAWHFAKYTDRVTAAGKKEYPLPCFVNAALFNNDQEPGEYPSGGPLPHLLDIWEAASPHLDFYAPDIYNLDFTYWCDAYHNDNNPLFIPEMFYSTYPCVSSLYAIGHHKAMGVSPFAIDSVEYTEDLRLTKANEVLIQLEHMIFTLNDTMDGVLLDQYNPTQKIFLGTYQFTCSFEPLDLFASKKNLEQDQDFKTGALIIMTGPDEFFIAGSGVIITFSTVNNENIWLAGIDRDEKGKFIHGQWTCLLRCNGDHTHQGRHVRLENDNFTIHRVTLYKYQ